MNMQRYFSKSIFKFLTLFTICLLFASCNRTKDCWVCDGDGENNCVVCVDGETNMGDCAFCVGKGVVTCTFCNGSGIMK